MARGDRESATDAEADHFLFDEDDVPSARHEHDAHRQAHGGPGGRGRSAHGQHSRGRGRGSRPRRRRGVFGAATVVLIVLVAAAAYFIGRPAYDYLHPADYSGQGSGSAVVTVQPDADAGQIGDALLARHVIASVRAFTDAAAANSNSQNIQAGSYRLHEHMSAKAAIAALLDPKTRLNTDLVVTEGATTLDVAQRMASPRCTASSPAGTVCGLALSKASVSAALADVRDLGLPTDFTVGRATPTSAEGFLYPATYAFADRTSALDVLQQMVSQFTDAVRATDFTSRAAALHLTPYQELIIASIAQAEARYPADMAKVATVILNRLHQHINLRIDATSAYAFRLEGLDPAKETYADAPGPYNTYTHAGLPPTPISNPGAEALQAAAHPTPGNWLYYVNADAAGHLFFTNSATAFERAAAHCAAEHWGCG